jgi:general secretion pathway protein D
VNRTRPGLSSTTFCCLALALSTSAARAQRPPPLPPNLRPATPIGSPDGGVAPGVRPQFPFGLPDAGVPRPAPAPEGAAPQPPPPPPAVARPPRNAPQGPGAQTIRPGGAPEAVGQRRANCEQIRRNAKFNIYFDKVEIEKLVQTVSDATCKTFILPENVRGRISIIGPENGKVEVNAEEFYRAFLAALDANNLALYTQGDFSKIVDKRNAKQTPIPTIGADGGYTSAEQMVTKIFKVKYVEIEPLRAVLQQLVSQNGDTIPFPPDTLIVNDLGSNMHRLQRIIGQLDTRSSSEEMRIIQIHYANAQEIADKIQKLFPAQQPGPGGRRGQRGGITLPPSAPQPVPGAPPGAAAAVPGGEPQAAVMGTDEGGGIVTVSQIIPDERTNKLIVIASPAGFLRIEDLVRMLDVPIPGEGRINVYYLENADAEDLAGTLQGLATGGAARPRATPGGPAIPLPGAQRAPTQTAELFSGEVKISADKATNSLVIIASQADYRNLIKVIQKLDMPRRQVFIEAVIMEVNVRRENKFGTRLHSGLTVPTADGNLPVLFGTKFGDQEALPPSLSILNLASFGGFLAGLQGPAIPGLRETLGIDIPAFGILLHAIQESSDANVLSTPHILTSDNEEAEITVGQNVPFQAGASPSALAGLGGLGTAAGATGAINPAQLSGLFGGLVTPINRQNVELKLTVKPQINDSDFIRLAITEQTEEIAGTHPVLGPTTSKRSAKTTVVARDQETIVLGGIMQDRMIEGVSKVPILGDLPILGHLFREETREKVKLNLLLFLTPYIIKDQSDFRRIFERKMKERQQFVEAFYGQVPGYEVTIDFGRKRGPFSSIDEALRREQQKIENGGSGAPGERLIVPGGTPSSAPRPGGQTSGEGAPNPGGSAEAPEPSPETRPTDERVRVSPGAEEQQD